MAHMTGSTASGSWLRAHPWVTDSVVAIAVLGYETMYIGFMHLEGGLGRATVLATVTAVCMCALYLFRRRWPVGVFIGVSGAAWVQTALGLSLAPGCMAMTALSLFNLTSRRNWRFAVPALAAVTAWVLVGSQPLMRAGALRIGEVGLLVLAAVCIASLGALARHRRAHLTVLQDRADQLARERDAQASIAAAEERARIAREIHDIVSHSLGTMVVMADGAVQTVGSEPEHAGQAMARVRDTGREAMTEMRRMLDVLREYDSAQRAPQPGLGSLDRLLAETRATGLRVDLTVTGAPVALPAGIDLAAYRIVQEALTNARKHGGPLLSVVAVTLSYRDGAIDLRVVDDGSDASTGTPSATGHGLVGMRERVAAYRGTLETGPLPGGGFEVHAVLPIGGTP